MNATEKQRLAKRIAAAVVKPLHLNDIYTRDMFWPGSSRPARLWNQQRKPVRTSFGPQIVNLLVSLAEPHKDLKAAQRYADEMAQSLAETLNLGARPVRVRIEPRGEYLAVQVPNPKPWLPTFPEVRAKADESILVGVDMQNQPVLIDLMDWQPGFFVYGRTGAGKTNLLRLFAAQAAAQGWAVVLVDVAKFGDGWEDIVESGILAGYAFSHDDAEVLFEELSELAIARQQKRAPRTPPVLVIIDEVMDVRKEQQLTLSKMVSSRRTANYRFLCGAQRPGKKISAELKNLFSSAFAGILRNESESSNAIGYTGCETLYKNGDMLMTLDGMAPKRLQTLRAEPPEDGVNAGDIKDLLAAADAPRVGVSFTKTPLPGTEPAQNTTHDRSMSSRRSPEPDLLRVPNAVSEGPIDLSPYGLPRTPRQVHAILEAEAERAGDGRKVPSTELIEWAVQHVRDEGKLPSFRGLKAEAQERDGTGYSQPRRRELRYLAAIAGRRIDLASDA